MRRFSADPQLPRSRRYFSGDYGHIDDRPLHFLDDWQPNQDSRSFDRSHVEVALAACPAKGGCRRRRRTGDRAGPLIAYLTRGGQRPRPAADTTAHRDVHSAHAERLRFVDALPLTASGKIDRKALALPPPPPEADPCDR
jgi:hypothetical protein